MPNVLRSQPGIQHESHGFCLDSRHWHCVMVIRVLWRNQTHVLATQTAVVPSAHLCEHSVVGEDVEDSFFLRAFQRFPVKSFELRALHSTQSDASDAVLDNLLKICSGMCNNCKRRPWTKLEDMDGTPLVTAECDGLGFAVYDVVRFRKDSFFLDF